MQLPIFMFCMLLMGWKTTIWCAPVPTRMIDLTYVYDNTTLVWPGHRKFEIRPYDVNIPELDTIIRAEEFSSATHVGTHVDAPLHFYPNGETMDDIPLEKLVAPAAVVDIRDKAALNRDYELQTEDLLQWENTTGYNLNEVIILVHSGWSRYWSNRTAYLGTSDNDMFALHFPGISASASQWLVTNRNVFGIGIDVISLDNGPSKTFGAHKNILGKNIYGIENVGNMEELPIFGATLYVMPMKIGGASGSPCRVIATFPDIIYGSRNST